jgi:hemolysin activation/secretion protein
MALGGRAEPSWSTPNRAPTRLIPDRLPQTRQDLLALLICCQVALAPEPGRAQGFCIDVAQIDLVGVTLLDSATQEDLTAPFEGRCMGSPQITDVLQAVTLVYVEAGYVTVRAYLPEQNLADGSLEIRVVEGELVRIEMNGDVQPRWHSRVFPRLLGAPVQLRDVEQGLDVIRSMPGYSPEMDITAGEESGGSILQVVAETDRPWTLQVATNNQGSDSSEPGQAAATGSFSTSASATWSHALGLNETWSLGLGKSIAENPFNLGYDGPGTRNADLGLRLPYGRWTTTFGLGWSDYATTTPGAFSPIDVTGETRTLSLGVEHLVHRDSDSKTWVGFNLTRRDVENRIADVRIEASSRVVTTLRLEGRHERPWNDGQLSLNGGLEAGLDLFGAEDATAQPVGTPDAQYALINAALAYQRALGAPEAGLLWNTSLRLQYGSDRFYGSEQFGLGGASTIRGTKTQLLAGSSGALWRNEVLWTIPVEPPVTLGKLQLYGGLDIGWVAEQDTIGVAGGTASGAVVGLRTLGGPLSLDISYSEVLSAPAGVATEDGTLLVSTTFRY